MSRIKDIVEKRVNEHKEHMQYIDGCDIKKETEYFFEKVLLTRVLDNKDYKTIMLSKKFIELFVECMDSRYDKKYTVMDESKLFTDITNEVKSYMTDIDYLRVMVNPLMYSSTMPASPYEIIISIDQSVFI